MKTQFITILLIALFQLTNVYAQFPTYDWAIDSDGPLDERIVGVAVDSNNNTYILGIIGPDENSFTIGGATITDANGKIFLCKLDPDGNTIWSLSTGSTPNGASTLVGNLSVDVDGNIYFTGYWGGVGKTITIGNTTLSNSFSANCIGGFYMAKFSTDGVFQWVKTEGTTLNVDICGSVGVTNMKVDNDNNIIATLSFIGITITLNGVVYNNANSGSADILVVKYNPSGDIIWSKLITSFNTTEAKGIAIDNDNNIYICGGSITSITFDPNWTLTTANENQIMYLVKYNSNGDVIGAKKCNTSGGNVATNEGFSSIDIYENDKIALTGAFFNELVLDNLTLSADASGASFIAIYDIGANALWGKVINGGRIKKVAFDNSGNIISGGIFFESVVIEGTTFSNPTLANTYDLFLVKYDINGNFVWHDTYGSIAKVDLIGIVARPDGNISIGGVHDGSGIIIGSNQLPNTGYVCCNFGYKDFFVTSIKGENSIVWTGNTSTNWNEPSNWVPQIIPTQVDDINIPSGRPRYPKIVVSNDVECRKMTIEDGATLTMNAGILSVWGEITAPNANVFALNGGTLKLYHGTTFPLNTNFNNLFIYNGSNAPAEQLYKFPGTVQIFGNFKVFGIEANPTLPVIDLGEGNIILCHKNVRIEKGAIGWMSEESQLADKTLFPTLRLVGASQQNIAFLNSGPNYDGRFKGNISVENPNTVFTGSESLTLMYNLIINSSFDLKGKRLRMDGKIVYADNFNSSLNITNSKPIKGSLDIRNNPDMAYDGNPQYIKIERLRSLYSNYVNTPNNSTILFTDLALDTIDVFGNLDLNGKNITIGALLRNTGYIGNETRITSSVSQGTLSLLGNNATPQYTLAVDAINNITLNSPAGARLINNQVFSPNNPSNQVMKLYGKAKLINGGINLFGTRIALLPFDINSSNNGVIVESGGNVFYSSIPNNTNQGVQYVGSTNNNITSKNYGGLGFIISSTALNNFAIFRYPRIETGINGGSSINRIYEILLLDDNSTSGLNALISIKYDESELNGLFENDLVIFRRSSDDPDNEWQMIPSTVDINTNTVTAVNPLPQLDYSNNGSIFYTLGSFIDPMRKEQEDYTNSVFTSNNSLIYPNPVLNSLNIRYSSEKPRTYQVFDVTGKLILTQTLNTTQVSMDVSILPSGMYVLQIVSEDQLTQQKFIKQ